MDRLTDKTFDKRGSENILKSVWLSIRYCRSWVLPKAAILKVAQQMDTRTYGRTERQKDRWTHLKMQDSLIPNQLTDQQTDQRTKHIIDLQWRSKKDCTTEIGGRQLNWKKYGLFCNDKSCSSVYLMVTMRKLGTTTAPFENFFLLW